MCNLTSSPAYFLTSEGPYFIVGRSPVVATSAAMLPRKWEGVTFIVSQSVADEAKAQEEWQDVFGLNPEAAICNKDGKPVLFLVEAEIILLCVCWYLRDALSYRVFEEIMQERGDQADVVSFSG